MLKKRNKSFFTSAIDFLHDNIIVVIVIFALIAGVAATVYIINQSNKNKNTSDSDTVYVETDTLSFAIETPKDLNVLTTKENDVFYMWPLLYSSLFKFGENLTLEQDLVESYSVDTEEGSVNLKLKNAIMANGKNLTGYDVRETVSTIKRIGEGSPFFTYANKISRISVNAENDITIYFNSETDASLNNLVFPILEKSDDEPQTEIQQGSGPYSFVDLDFSNGIKLIPNENYYGKKPTKNLELKFVNDKKAISGLMDMGTITGYVDRDSSIDEDDSSKVIDSKRIPSTEVDVIGFNFRNPHLNKKGVRQAIAMSIDSKALIADYLGDKAASVGNIYYPNYLGVDNSKKLDYQPAKASKNLEKLGYKYDKKSKFLVDKNGNTLTLNLLVNSDNKSRIDMAKSVKKYMNKIGVDVNVEELPRDEYFSRISSGSFDMYIGGFKMDPRFDLRKVFDKSGPIGYSNEDAIAKISSMERCISIEDRNKLYGEASNLLIEDVPYYTIGYKEVTWYTGKEFTSNSNPSIYDIYYGCNGWDWKRPEGVPKEE